MTDNTEKNQNQVAKKKIFIFLGILFIIGLIYGAYWLLWGKNNIETEDAYVNSNQNVITTQVAGTVKAVYVEDTQYVKKGQLLVEIDDTNYKLALESATATLAKTVRAVSNLTTNVSVAEEALKARKTQLNQAMIEYNMNKESYQAGLISKFAFESTKNNLKVVEAEVARAKQTLEEAKTQANSKNIYEHPEIQQGIANFKSAYTNLMRTKIYAPEDGIIAKKSIFLGQQVVPSQQLMSVINLDNIWVDANFKETQLKDIKVGNLAKLHSDINGKTYEGYVIGISGGSGSALSLLPAQNATGNWIKVVQRIPVRIAIDPKSLKDNGTIPIGSSVVAKVITTENKKEIPEYKGVTTNLYTINNDEVNKIIDNIIKENMNAK